MKRTVFRNVRVAFAMLAGIFAIALALAARKRVTVSDETALNSFTTIDFPGATRSQARYLNSRGDVVGFYRWWNSAWFPAKQV